MPRATLDVPHTWTVTWLLIFALLVMLARQRWGLLVVAVVVEGPLPLVHQVRQVMEATVVLAPSSPSQAPPPHTLGEVGVRRKAAAFQAVVGQGVGAKALSLRLFLVPLVLPTLVMGAGVEYLEHQVAPAL
jgi:hypothetical protein